MKCARGFLLPEIDGHPRSEQSSPSESKIFASETRLKMGTSHPQCPIERAILDRFTDVLG